MGKMKESISVSAASLARSESNRLAMGRGHFVDDMELPRMLHLAFVRSPVAHASLTRVDVATARQMPGVAGAFSAADFEPLIAKIPQTKLDMMPGHISPPQKPLAGDIIRYQGELIAAIAAETAAQAHDACEAIKIEYSDRPAVISPSADPSDKASIASTIAIKSGDNGAETNVRLEASFTFARQAGVTMEPRGIIADFDASESQLNVWHSHQSPHLVQALLADILGLPENQVLVRATDVGGGFGVKLHLYSDEIATAIIAKILGRPVKYIATRSESFLSDAQAREFETKASITLNTDGSVCAMEAEFTNSIGAYSIFPRSSVGDAVQAATQMGAPYNIELLSTKASTIWQNKVPSGAIRGVGQPIPCVVTEQLMDRAARHLGEDPAAFRRRHYLSADAYPLTTRGGIYMDRLSLHECLDLMLDKMSYKQLRKDQKRLRNKGIIRGIGIATFIEQTAVGPGLYGAAGIPATSLEETRIRLEADGTFRVETGATDQGQGTLTGIRQIVAGILATDVNDVRVGSSDSGGARGGGAWASRGLSLAGEAAAMAAEKLRDNILTVAAALLQTSSDTIELAGGTIRSESTESIKLTELARRSWYRPHELPENVTELFAVSSTYLLEGRPHLMANGVQASLVEIDLETGVVTPLQHWIVEDCGNIINPALVDGQLMGGAAQGIGGALGEACVYGEDGQLLTGSFLDYAIARADNIPSFEIHHVTTPQVGTKLGVKGVGEAGVVGAPAAIWSAVNDALAHLNVTVDCQPITSAAVFKAISRA